jgi:acetyltransferase
MNRQRRWLDRPAGTVRNFEVDTAAANHALAQPGDNGYLPLEAVRSLLAAYGIPTLATRVARTADEAVSAARTIGLPVAAKVLSPDIVHKTEVGGVQLDLRSDADVRDAFEAITRSAAAAQPGARIDGVLIEQFVRGGREVIVGMSQDPSFGSILMFGLGGIYVEALKDVAFRIQPVSDVDAREMIDSIRGVQLLRGMRGEKPSDFDVLIEIIQRVSQLVGDHPEIREMDINPFVVFEKGGVAVDARVRVQRA